MFAVFRIPDADDVTKYGVRMAESQRHDTRVLVSVMDSNGGRKWDRGTFPNIDAAIQRAADLVLWRGQQATPREIEMSRAAKRVLSILLFLHSEHAMGLDTIRRACNQH
ncbi:MAG: hypothetical protein CMB99_01035 [Flavobacteriaceae bacterium]|nr:hypothetical protein [Flavobacteriaceae bacterium]